MPWKIQTHSFSKVRVYFADGKKGTFFSMDWLHVYSKHRDQDLGLKRLRNLICEWGPKAKVALLYDIATDKLIEKYIYGIKKTN